MKGKQIFNKITNSNVFWMVLSVLISLIMWTYLESREIKPTEKVFEGIKVEFRGLSEDMYVLEPSPAAIDFTISGPSRLVSQLSAEDLTASVDVSGLSAQSYSRKCSIVLPDSLSEEEKAELHVSFTVNNIFTENNVSFRLSNRKTVQVDVIGTFEGSLSDNCHIGTISFEPKQISLTGPEYYLNNVAYVSLLFGEGEQIDRNFTEALYKDNVAISSEGTFDISGFQFSMKTRDDEDYNNNSITYSAELALTMPVYRTEKFSIKVDDSSIKYTAGATPENTTCTISPTEIELSGIPSELNDMERTLYVTPKIDTRTIVDYDDSEGYFYTKRTLKLSIPEGLSARGESTDVSLTIHIKDLITRDFLVTQFSVLNPPEGYSTKVLTTSLNVTLRGPADILNSINPGQIVGEIDLDGKEPGSNPIYTPEIKVEGYDDKVGMIGKIDPVSIVFEAIEED